MRKFIYFTVLLFLVLIPNKTNASCDNSEIVRLQKLASNVNYNVVYDNNSKQFILYFLNLKKDLILNDTYTGKNYNVDGELTIVRNASGDYKFNVYANNKECNTSVLISRYINVPYYNGYYDSDLCKGIEDYSYCSKWLKAGNSVETIISKIKKYRENLPEEKEEQKNEKSNTDIFRQKLINFYSKYYIVILVSIILIFGIPVYIKEKNSRLV